METVPDRSITHLKFAKILNQNFSNIPERWQIKMDMIPHPQMIKQKIYKTK